MEQQQYGFRADSDRLQKSAKVCLVGTLQLMSIRQISTLDLGSNRKIYTPEYGSGHFDPI